MSDQTKTSLLHCLSAFNRKERFWLLHHTLGFAGNSFQLGAWFQSKLSHLFAAEVIPDNAFVAMDYHLDWLHLALCKADGLLPDRPFPDDGFTQFTIEDVDLLIAYASGDKTNIVLIEAKGDTAWSNKQLASKARRLGHIFGWYRPNFPNVVPRFVLMSPKKPQDVNFRTWPEWMRGDDSFFWLPLPMSCHSLKHSKCHEDGTLAKDGQFVRIDSVRNFPHYTQEVIDDERRYQRG